MRVPALRWIPLLALAIVAVACAGPRAPERIVLVVIDTLRDDHVGGSTPPTPHLDALAARGQRVRGMRAAYHQTTMSMAALFTGRTPSLERADGSSAQWTARSWCGLLRLAEPGGPCVPASVPTLAETLRDVGYRTLGVTSNPLLFDPAGYSRGFDVWSEVGRTTPPDAADPQGALSMADVDPYDWKRRTYEHVEREVVRVLDANPGTPTFLYVHLMEVHDYELRGETYPESVREADRAVGALLALLASRGFGADTLFVVTSDHGERLAGETHVLRGTRAHFGNPSFEQVLRVPLIVAPPLFEGEGPALLRSDDLFRRIAEAAGAETGPADLAPDELFVSEGRYRTYQRGSWKSYEARADGRLVLVDLQADPTEQQDAGVAHPEVVAEHRARTAELSRSLAATDDGTDALSADDRARLESLGYLEPGS